MNNGAFGENFPYSNFHDLNMDWIIKIAKDFLDQYSHIQEVIENGEESLQDLTTNGLEQLQTKAEQLEELLQQWYNTHSEDIADQLADALDDIQTALTETVAEFNTRAENKGAEVIASIPDDYSALSAEVQQMEQYFSYIPYLKKYGSRNLLVGSPVVFGKYFINGAEGTNTNYNYSIIPVTAGTTYKMHGVRYVTSASETYLDNGTSDVDAIFKATNSENVYVTFTSNPAVNFKVYFGNIEYVGIPNPESYYHTDIDTDYIRTIFSTMIDYTNLFRLNRMATGYCKINDQWVTGAGYTSYDTFIFNVTAGTTYKFGCDIRFMNKDDTAIGSSLPEGYEYIADSNGVLYCSINRTLLRAKAKAVALPNSLDDTNSAYEWTPSPTVRAYESGNSRTKLMTQYGATQAIKDNIELAVTDKIYSEGYKTISGELTNGDTLTLRSTTNKKNNVYSLMMKLTSFDTIRLGEAKNRYGGAWIDITSTKVIVHNYFNSDSTTEYTHGLTIQDYVYVQITVAVGTAVINIMSNNNTYTSPEVSWTGYGNGTYFVESVNTVGTAEFTWCSGDFRKPIWIMGDSYVDITNVNRWATHIIRNGYGNNVLVAGYGGEDSETARDNLRNMIAFYGKPKTLLWCLGMNDSADIDTTPDSTWKDVIDVVVELCSEHDIELVLATIPSIPSKNHEGKNNWIRNSGFRYIDMASAVGASASGVWYTGMLSNDNVHPTQMGAKALYYECLTGLPEITYSNP